MQVAEPEVAYFPAEHLVQAVAPLLLTLPERHVEQVPAPWEEEYLPPVQVRHAVAPEEPM